ncbi:putative transcriptional regulatory protein [Acaryochloris thomasi RCC1774]|uniref:Probable transcriptional regulatory protein C1752_03642 n=1 Tax=Acaryochloris thomasi RCC1774 TaxID=1764569 RepID=A0A2W1JVE2_9CYAN|nr:YebC/PmpR family DNA-binding transcriptional regulator [Acaryochloris thomasi]PZD72447.1 putative transcriptional regulatory protein [Acaryochloris thomasi RCC1774]
MAGHSKWANIKRQKARVDAKKGKVFARLSRAMIVAARNGLPDPAANFQLRWAIEKAKAAGIPNENIERAIAKGSGQLGADENWEDIQYEGYGPSGVAVLIEALTDNRNRTAADLRSAFSKHGGNLGEKGCVGWMFESKGIITLAGPLTDEEDFLETLLELGAESYEILEDDDGILVEVCTHPNDLEQIAEPLQVQGYTVKESETRWLANNTVDVVGLEPAQMILKLMDVLEDLDDVQTVTANFELQDSLLAELDLE